MATVIAGWAAEAIIGNLVDAAYNFIAEKSNLFDLKKENSMNEDLDRLHIRRAEIQQVFSAIEKGPVTIEEMDSGLRDWLWKLRDAVDAAEDLLDDFEYQRLEEKVNTEGVKVPSTSNPSGKFVKLSVFGNNTPIRRLTEVLKQLDDVTSNINVIIHLALNLKLDAERMHHEIVKSRETGPIQTERKFVGRDKEKKRLKGWILNSELNSEPADGISHVSLLTMVGLGGLGKTTLVQEIYNDAEVRNYFTKMIWVCVSNNFEPPQVLYKIMEYTCGDNSISRENFGMVQETLQAKLISEKFLIVLDDVWEDVHFDRWEKLVAPIRFGKNGSKVLVTTRMSSVAKMAKKVMEEAVHWNFNLKSLDYPDFLCLFNRFAFAGVKIDNYKYLESLSQQFSQKLGGVPLLAKVVGGLLNSSLDHAQWKRIFETDVMNFDNGDKKILEVLKLSYQKLPIHLQACLRYCSLFSEDYKFNKDELIQMWMTAGLIRQSQPRMRRPEDVGEDYFNSLVEKSFFDEYPSGGYSMHDCLHQIVCSLSREECYYVKNLDSIYVPQTIRHLAIRVDDISILQAIAWPTNLRTLIIELNEGDEEISILLNDLLGRLSYLRVLKLYGRGLYEFPIAIGDLLHLRYIFFESDHLLVVPNCFSKLYHIQVIQVYLPEIGEPIVRTTALSKLTKLRYFSIAYDNHTFFASSYPAFGKLTSLQKLDEFTVKDEDGYKLEELNGLDDLQNSLRIDGLENVQNDNEGSNASLNKKKLISSLSFVWRSNNSTVGERRRLDSDSKLLDCLLPHSELRELEIEGYNSFRPPYWLQKRFLSNLISVKFVRCERLVQLPPLGQLPFLKFLYLRELPALEKIGIEFYGEDGCVIFPALEIMDMEALPKCTEWLGFEKANSWFPCLSQLYIYTCPRLRQIPALPLSLKHAELNNLGLLSLPSMWLDRFDGAQSNSASISSFLFSLEIRACPNLRSLDEGFLQAQESLVSLEKLKIWYCNELTQLPTSGFASFSSLKTLYLMCPQSLAHSLMPENMFPHSLEKLHIFGDIEILFPKLFSLESLSALELGQSWITSLPEMEMFKRLSALEDLSIRHCNKIISLGGLNVATFLKELSLKGCTKLDKIELCSGLSSLEKVIIRDCNGLKTLEISHTLSSFKDLTISRCTKLSSIVIAKPLHGTGNDDLVKRRTMTLQSCWIECCVELSSLGFLYSLTTVQSLYIDGCQRLAREAQNQLCVNQIIALANGVNSLFVNHLTIDDPSYLLLAPLNILNSIKILCILDCSRLLSLPERFIFQNRFTLRKLVLEDLTSLESLPNSLRDLSSLEELYMSGITKIETLPLLPFPLKILEIKGCNILLEQKYRRKSGVNWPNIAHVPSITIKPFTTSFTC